MKTKCFSVVLVFLFFCGSSIGSPKFLQGAQEADARVLKAIYDLDVISYYDLADQYDSDLKRKVFSKSEEYKNRLEELKTKKQGMLSNTYYVVYPSKMDEYETKIGGFKMSIGCNIDAGGDSGIPKTINGIYFPSLRTRRESLAMDGMLPQGVYSETLIVPMSEEKGLSIENDLSNVVAYFLFRVSGITHLQYKGIRQAGWYSGKADLITASDVRLIIGNKNSDEIYFDKSYVTNSKKK